MPETTQAEMLLGELSTNVIAARATATDVRNAAVDVPPDFDWLLFLELVGGQAGRAMSAGRVEEAAEWLGVLRDVIAAIDQVSKPPSRRLQHELRDEEAALHISLALMLDDADRTRLLPPLDLKAWVTDALPMTLDEARETADAWQRASTEEERDQLTDRVLELRPTKRRLHHLAKAGALVDVEAGSDLESWLKLRRDLP